MNDPLNKAILGSLEYCDLPELTISQLEVRVDTGAKTSSLHVDNIAKCKINGKPGIKFDIHPDSHGVDTIIHQKARIKDVRRIKSSNGSVEQRYVIRTPITIGEFTWDIEITLTDRSDMSYLMLLGREAIGDRFLVDPSQVFLLSNSDSTE